MNDIFQIQTHGFLLGLTLNSHNGTESIIEKSSQLVKSFFLIDKYNFLWSNFGKIGHFLQPL